MQGGPRERQGPQEREGGGREKVGEATATAVSIRNSSSTLRRCRGTLWLLW